MTRTMLRVAVIGHVEHITLGRVPALPGPGEIAHLDSPRFFPGGGGGVAFFQLCRNGGRAEVLLFTAVGNDDGARAVESEVQRRAPGARVYAARRDVEHTRDVVMVTPEGERTIVVVGEPLHPRRADELPWDALAGCDAVYFTAQDPEALRAARAARVLVVSARRREALAKSGVRADVIVGSASDAREKSALSDYAVAPGALVLTEGRAGGRIETAAGITRFRAPSSAPTGGAAYGAGDSFAGALTFYLAAGAGLVEACERAGYHGAAVLAGLNPLDFQRELA